MSRSLAEPLPSSSAALAEEEAAYRQHQAKAKPPSLALTFAAAGLGNSLSAICTNPADIVKVRQQLLTERARPSFARIGIDMARNEGLTSLWNGVTASCLREASYSTIRMGSYELFKDLYSNVLPPTSFAVKLLSGITSGAIGSAIATPTDLLKVRMQAARPAGRPPYRNTFVGFVEVFREGAMAPATSTAVPQAVARAVTQSGKAAAAASQTPAAAAVQETLAGWQGGVRALYRGVGPNVLRAAVLTSSQVGTYDETKTFFKSSGLLNEGIGLHLAASTVAGEWPGATASKRRNRLQNRSQGSVEVVAADGKDNGGRAVRRNRRAVGEVVSLSRCSGQVGLTHGSACADAHAPSAPPPLPPSMASSAKPSARARQPTTFAATTSRPSWRTQRSRIARRSFSSSAALAAVYVPDQLPEQLKSARDLLRQGFILRGMQLVIDHLSSAQTVAGAGAAGAAAPSSDHPIINARDMEPVLLDICAVLNQTRRPKKRSPLNHPRKIRHLIDGPLWRPPQLLEEEEPDSMPVGQQCVAALATLFDLMTKEGVTPTTRSLTMLLTTFSHHLAPEVVEKTVDVAIGAKGSLETDSSPYDFDDSRFDLGLLCTVVAVLGRTGQPWKGERFLSIWAQKRGSGISDSPTLGELHHAVSRRLGISLPRPTLDTVKDLSLCAWSGDTAIWNALIRSRVLLGDLEGARTWLEQWRLVALFATQEELRDAGRPDKVSWPYLTLMEGYTNVSLRFRRRPPPAHISFTEDESPSAEEEEEDSRLTRAKAVRDLLNLLAKDGVEPDHAVANFIISYQSGIGSPHDVAKLLLDMFRRGVLRYEKADGSGEVELETSTVGAIFRLQTSIFKSSRGTSTSPFEELAMDTSSASVDSPPTPPPPSTATSEPDFAKLFETCSSPRSLFAYLFRSRHDPAKFRRFRPVPPGEGPRRSAAQPLVERTSLNQALSAAMYTRDFPLAMVVLRTFVRYGVPIDHVTRSSVLMAWGRIGGFKDDQRRRVREMAKRFEEQVLGEGQHDDDPSAPPMESRPFSYSELAAGPDGGLADLETVVRRAIVLECRRARHLVYVERAKARKRETAEGPEQGGSEEVGKDESSDGADEAEAEEWERSRLPFEFGPPASWAQRLEPKVREHMRISNRDEDAVLKIVMADAWKTILPGGGKRGADDREKERRERREREKQERKNRRAVSKTQEAD